MKSKCLVVLCLLLVASPTYAVNADRICPKGALIVINSEVSSVWNDYNKQNIKYVDQILRRHSRNLKKVLDAQSLNDQLSTAKDLGEDNVLFLQRMFEAGFIAAIDLLYAHCPEVSTQESWSNKIKKENEQKFCELMANEGWGVPHFCDRKRFCEKNPIFCN